MAKRLQLRKGTTVEHSTFTGALGEVTVDTTKDTVVVHDGILAGGHPLRKEVDSYNKTEVDQKITDLVAAAPGALDTLNELAAALGDDANFASTMTTALAGKQATLTFDAVPTDGSTNPVQSNGVFDALNGLFIDQQALLPKAGGTMTGAITALRETKVAMGANDIALASGNLFTKTISGATTLTVSNWLATGNANSFILELTNGGSAVVTWFAGVKWASGTAPTLTTAGVDILGFYSHDGGTTIRGIVLAKDSK